MPTDSFHALHHVTVPDWLRQQARAHRFRLALSAPSHRGYRDRLGYAQLVERMHAMARGLYARGLRQGDRLVLLLPNTAAREGVLTALLCTRRAIGEDEWLPFIFSRDGDDVFGSAAERTQFSMGWLAREAQLRAAGGLKWTAFPGCIGAFVAEMDFGIAPPIRDALHEAVERGQVGYLSAAPLRAMAEAWDEAAALCDANGERNAPAFNTVLAQRLAAAE